MKILRKIIQIDEELCDGCGQCVPACEEGAIEVVDGKARLVAEKYCDGLGACLGHCPTGALKIVEKEAEDFDEEAVHEYLASKKHKTASHVCPSQALHSFETISCDCANKPDFIKQQRSLLGHWPIQIRLVPPHAPFLKNSDLLIVADCTAVAYPNFHQHFVGGKIVLMGCPKFDDQMEYVNRFKEIFAQNPISSLSTVIMEVPCCSSMLGILKKALEDANQKMNINYTIIGIKGSIIDQKELSV